MTVQKVMDEIDFDIEDNQDALRGLYTAIENHQGFWNDWLSHRMGFMGEFFAAEEEIRAAIEFGQALLILAESVNANDNKTGEE